jgi:hypothetical protein
MRYVLNCTVAAIWALWFGGLITLFLSVTALARTARSWSAPILFRRFEFYQLILAGSAIAAALVWRRTARSGARLVILVAFVLAGIGSTVAREAITPRLEALVLSGQGKSAQFMSLHGTSMLIYLADTAALAVAGLALPAAMKSSK